MESINKSINRKICNAQRTDYKVSKKGKVLSENIRMATEDVLRKIIADPTCRCSDRKGPIPPTVFVPWNEKDPITVCRHFPLDVL